MVEIKVSALFLLAVIVLTERFWWTCNLLSTLVEAFPQHNIAYYDHESTTIISHINVFCTYLRSSHKIPLAAVS